MNICIFCSANSNLPTEYFDRTRELGAWIGANGHTLVFGGCNLGLMECVAEAVHNAKGMTVGVVPSIVEKGGKVSEHVDVKILCDNLSDRKDLMIEKGDAYICLPGGIGTIDEWISTLSHLIVAGIENKKPIFVVNYMGMYDNLVAQLRECAHSPFARGKNIDCSHIASDTNNLIEKLNNFISKLL